MCTIEKLVSPSHFTVTFLEGQGKREERGGGGGGGGGGRGQIATAAVRFPVEAHTNQRPVISSPRKQLLPVIRDAPGGLRGKLFSP